MFFPERRRKVFDLQQIQVFKLQEIKPIIASLYKELTADKIYPKVKGDIENLADYFPEYDSTYIPNRKCFLDIF